MKATIILNASSGWAHKRKQPGRLRDIFASRGFDVELLEVRRGIDLSQVARDAVRRGAERVIAAGGDGTLRAIASGVAGTGVEFAVLPAGTLNHFARDLGFPTDLEAAAEAVAEGVPVWVDAGEVNGHIFLNNSVLGLFPSYRFEKAHHMRRGWSRNLAILPALLAMFQRFPMIDVRIRTGDRELVRRTPHLLIANNEQAMEGFKPWQRERLTEGKLWIYIMHETTRAGLLHLILKALTGRLRAGERFEVLRASEVLVWTHHRRSGVGIDGEIKVLNTPLHYRSLARELRVIVPKDSKRLEEFVCELPGGASSGS